MFPRLEKRLLESILACGLIIEAGGLTAHNIVQIIVDRWSTKFELQLILKLMKKFAFAINKSMQSSHTSCLSNG